MEKGVPPAQAAREANRRRLDEMTEAAAELIRRAIDEAEPDPKILKHITGALKEFRELVAPEAGAAGADAREDVVIRIEGDVEA